ncbi:hypothetical protein [Novimethylophilus kurashikiensis]|nr:hypothetical protein [Novimethylophilus kurashikiensis]
MTYNKIKQNSAHKNKGDIAAKHDVLDVVSSGFVNLVGMFVSAIIFVAIMLIAGGLGFILHWAQVNFPWMPHWMIDLGHILEASLFVLDCAGLFWSVLKHSVMQFKHA